MRRYFDAQIAEIASTPALRRYGVALSLIHLLTLAFWRGGATLARYVEDPITICWATLPGCRAWSWLWSTALAPVTWAYVAASVAATVLWWRGSTRRAYAGLAVASGLKLLLYSIDYREMGNYHYMPLIITALFLFVPRKIEVMRLVIVGFYIGAGALKFNREWLSGAAIFGHPILAGRWLVLGCLSVVGLEMVISLGLLSRASRVFWPSFGAFVLFHLFSWHIVGFFYPLVMFALLSLFVLARDHSAGGLDDLFAGRLARSTFATLAVFVLLQVPPVFSRTDSALTGEGRLFALNMFDARVRCQAQVWIERDGDDGPTAVVLDDPMPNLGTRIHCEPWVYREYARSVCATGDARAVTLRLQAKRSSDQAYTPTLDERLVCAAVRGVPRDARITITTED